MVCRGQELPGVELLPLAQPVPDGFIHRTLCHGYDITDDHQVPFLGMTVRDEQDHLLVGDAAHPMLYPGLAVDLCGDRGAALRTSRDFLVRISTQYLVLK